MRLGPLLALALAAAPAPAAEFLGAIEWRAGIEGAGGWSALWLDPAGPGFVTVSDRGIWARGTLSRDGSGAIDGVETRSHGPLRDLLGRPLDPTSTDAESIAVIGGTAYVGFEGDAVGARGRVVRYETLDGRPYVLRYHPDIFFMNRNGGLEALAADTRGALYAIPEMPVFDADVFQVYLWRDGYWDTPFAIARRGRYLVTGADIGPDGRLYVLERAFLGVGFRTRIRSFDRVGRDERVELETPLGRHDNLEGIAVRRDPSGRLRATMVSDDNFRPWMQRTEIVEYLLD